MKIYEDPYQIDLDELPEQFVLKTNHGSGFNIMVNKKMAEFHYSFIKRKIFAEEYIGENLNNYKFFCYDSKPIFIYLSKKIGNNKYRTFFDMNWNRLDNYIFW